MTGEPGEKSFFPMEVAVLCAGTSCSTRLGHPFSASRIPTQLRPIGQEEAAQLAASEVERRTGNINPLRDSDEGFLVIGSRQPLLEGLRTLWRGIYLRRTIVNWVFGFCIGFFNFGFIVWLPTTLKNLGYTDAQS